MYEQLKYFLNTLSTLTKIPCSVWSMDVNDWICFSDQDYQHFIFYESNLPTEILTKYINQSIPFIYEEQKVFFTGICKCSDNLFAITGPIVITEPTNKEKNTVNMFVITL